LVEAKRVRKEEHKEQRRVEEARLKEWVEIRARVEQKKR
jgi:hypothetical protein